MKSLKMLGLAAVATMALTAAFGASSASATVLCTTTSTPCGSAWHVDTIEASIKAGSSAILRATGFGAEATCGTGSSLTATKKTTGSSTTTPVGSVAKAGLTWSSCTNITNTLGGGEIEVHHIAGTDNGTVTAKGFEITVVFSSVTCVYGAPNGVDLGTLTGGHNATLHFTANPNKVAGSFICPSHIVWEGDYTITNHTNVFVTAS
jgi:hypothetical protein